MTPSQAKAINASSAMKALVHAQRYEGAKIVGKSVRKNTVMNWIEIQIRTDTTAYDWKVTPRGRVVHQQEVEMV